MFLQEQLIEAFSLFATELRSETFPVARERELISFFAFGPLLDIANRGVPPLKSARQIGIECAVPQRAPRAGEHPKESVCKDLVIWSEPVSSRWGVDGKQRNCPLAILEWKATTRSAADIKSEHSSETDREKLLLWLDRSNCASEAYTVLVTGSRVARRVTLTRVSREESIVLFRSGAAGA